MKTISIKEFLKGKDIGDAKVFVSKYRNCYLLGPIINKNTNLEFFRKRLISSSICEIKKYSNVNRYKTKEILNNFFEEIRESEMLEIKGKKVIAKHEIISFPEVKENEEKVISK